MIQASVGYQCPDCVNAGSAKQRTPRPSRSPGRGLRTVGSQSATVILIGLLVLSQVVDAITGGIATGMLAFQGEAVLAGQVWRMVTFMVVPGGFLSMLISGFVLWIIGRSMESVLGKPRFLATFLLSGFGAAAVMMLIGPLHLGILGSSISIIGLLSANATFKYRHGEEIRSDLILLGILVAFSVVTFPPSVLADVGAILGGGASGWVWSSRGKGPMKRRGNLSVSDQVHLRGAVMIVAGFVVLTAIAFLIR